MKIAVLAGGTSTEREISIVSGSKVCEALRKKGHQATFWMYSVGRKMHVQIPYLQILLTWIKRSHI